MEEALWAASSKGSLGTQAKREPRKEGSDVDEQLVSDPWLLPPPGIPTLYLFPRSGRRPKLAKLCRLC